MKIIIIGDGKVGFSLAEHLSKENNDVTIIDKNPEALKKAHDNLDVMCIKGNGVSMSILLEAGVREVDLLIAATSSDELNMVCCLTAKKLGAEHTIARIRDPEYAKELTILKRELGLDMVINPEQTAAGEIARLLRFPSAVNVELFAKGRVELVEAKVTPGMPIIGMMLKDIAKKVPSQVLIGAVLRQGEITIPGGEFQIQQGDTIYALGRPSNISLFFKQNGKLPHKVKNVMLVGGGRIAYYLARYLGDAGMKVKIIEINRQRCTELSEALPNTLIICGDGSDESVLLSENLGDMDAFVSVTGRDEENLISALLAKHAGVPKVVAKINRMNYSSIVKGIGLDSVVSPKEITTNDILKYVRGLKNASGNQMQTLYRIIDDKAEALEFAIDDFAPFLNIPIRQLRIAKGVLIATIVRKNEIIIPRGGDVLKAGDCVIFIARDRRYSDISEIISPEVPR